MNMRDHAKTLTPLFSKASPTLNLKDANIREGYILETGQVVTVVVDVEVLTTLTNLGAALRIYEPMGHCVYTGELREIDHLPQGQSTLHFYFMATLPDGDYAISFEFSKRVQQTEAPNLGTTPLTKDNTNSIEASEFIKHHSWQLLSLNNLFVEFSVENNSLNNQVHEAGNSGYVNPPSQIVVFRNSFAHEEIAKEFSSTNTSKDFPWPLEESKFTKSEICDAFLRITGVDNGIPPASFSLMTPRCGPRIFTADCPRIASQIGVRTQGKISSTGKAGILLYGPYLPIAAGHYLVTFRGNFGDQLAKNIKIDVVAKKGGVTLAEKDFSTLKKNVLEVSLDFNVPSAGYKDVEFRLVIDDGIFIEIKDLLIEPFGEMSDNATDEMTRWVSKLLKPIDSDATGMFDYKEKYKGIDFIWNKHPRLMTENKLALIFVPADMFLPFCLTISDFIKKRYKIQSILIYLEWSPFLSHALAYNNAACETVSYTDFLDFIENHDLNAELFISHSFGWENEIKVLLNKVKASKFLVYGDGFKQSVHSTYNKYQHINGAICFGSISSNLDVTLEENICPLTVIEWYKKLSKAIVFHEADEHISDGESYAVVYLRYYGNGVYQFDAAIGTEIMFQTIINHIGNITNIVIKNDKRVPIEVLGELISALKLRGFNAISLEDYFDKRGGNPALAQIAAEFLFLSGYLCDAAKHICFDSTVCYSIATLRKNFHPTSILIGADLDFLGRSNEISGGHLISLDHHPNKNKLFVPNDPISIIKVCSKVLVNHIFENSFFGVYELKKPSAKDVYEISINPN